MNATAEREALANRLHLTVLRMVRWFRVTDAKLGLSNAQLRTLSQLVGSGPTTMGELAAAAGVRAPTMTGIVDLLERDRLVVRRPDRDDRRRSLVEATHRAWVVLEREREQRARALADAIDALPARDRRTLSRAVEILESIVDVA